MRKPDGVVVTASDRGGVKTLEPGMSEPIGIVQEFDNKLKSAIFTVNRHSLDMQDDNVHEATSSTSGRTYFQFINVSLAHQSLRTCWSSIFSFVMWLS